MNEELEKNTQEVTLKGISESFFSYYISQEEVIKKLKEEMETLTKESTRIKSDHRKLREVYNNVASSYKALNEKYNEIQEKYNNLVQNNRQVLLEKEQIEKELKELKKNFKELKDDVILTRTQAKTGGRPKVQLSDEDIEWIMEQRESGASLRAIARDLEGLNVSHQTIKNIIQEQLKGSISTPSLT